MHWLYQLIKKASPISSENLYNLHDKDIRKHAPGRTEIVVFHGTSSKKLAQMLQSGFLIPSPGQRAYQNSSEGIYVTTSLGLSGAEMYGWHASQSEEGDGSDPVVLELQVPLNWIEKDTDDSRLVDRQGKQVPNEASFTQGRILKPINVKRIRQIQIVNSVLSQLSGYQGESTIFDAEKTSWIPIGKMMDLVGKALKKGQQLGPEYLQMTNVRPRGLSRHPAGEDIEERVAMGLLTILHTFGETGSIRGRDPFDVTLGWVYKTNINGQASQLLPQYLEFIQPGLLQDYEAGAPEEYRPRPGESLYNFALRQA